MLHRKLFGLKYTCRNYCFGMTCQKRDTILSLLPCLAWFFSGFGNSYHFASFPEFFERRARKRTRSPFRRVSFCLVITSACKGFPATLLWFFFPSLDHFESCLYFLSFFLPCTVSSLQWSFERLGLWNGVPFEVSFLFLLKQIALLVKNVLSQRHSWGRSLSGSLSSPTSLKGLLTLW